MSPPLLIHGMKGLGDNIFQRPFVRAACARHAEVYLETPWPELYEDLPQVRPVRTFTKLRTQGRNERTTAARWYDSPRAAVKAHFTYAGRELRTLNILESLERGVPLNRGDRLALDLPASCQTPPAAVLDRLGPVYAVVRPATVRREWANPARNPRPEYLAQAAAALRARGIPVVVVADLVAGEEDLVGELPPHDLALLGGELPIRSLLGLVAGAAAVVGGVGWLVPAALALRRPALIVVGGNGMHNAPEKITDPRLDLSRMTFALPARLCMCEGKGHECTKRVWGFPRLVQEWTSSLSIPA